MTFINYDDIRYNNLGLNIITFKENVLSPLLDVRHSIRHKWFDEIKQLLKYVTLL